MHSKILFVYAACWVTVVKDEKFESGNKIKHDGWCHECFRNNNNNNDNKIMDKFPYCKRNLDTEV